MFRTCIVNTDTNLVVNVIDYETEQTGTPPGFDENYLCVPSEFGIIGASYVGNVIVNPPEPVWSDDILLANCKMLASELLFETDWTQSPDCPLLNKQEFIEWRAIIRNFALSPVTNPIFPQKPVCAWE
jgi:hypothetical protein